MAPADVGILTTVNLATFLISDSTDVVHNFDYLFYIYFALIIFITSGVITTINISTLKSLKNRRQWLLKLALVYKDSVWQIVTVIVDQENYQPKQWPTRLVWAAFNISSLVLVYGYFLNFMSTEQSVQKKSAVIDSLDDLLYDPVFKLITPVIIKALFEYNVLKSASKSSEEGKLFKRLSDNGNESILDVRVSTLGFRSWAASPLRKMLDELIEGKVALISTGWAEDNIELLVPKLFGDMMETKKRTFHSSSNTFLRGTFCLFYSKQIDPRVRRYMDYR